MDVYDIQTISNAIGGASYLCTVDNGDDTDGDGVCDDVDICPGGDDNADSDSDGVPNFCDPCNGFPNAH